MSQPAAATLASVDPPPPIVYAPPAGVPQILFMDEVLLVIDKPAGLLSVPGRGPDHADSLASRIQAEYPDARIVHRLDLATSGLLVMARGHEMERRLSIAFQQRQVDKYYVAVVAGHPQPERSQIMVVCPRPLSNLRPCSASQ